MQTSPFALHFAHGRSPLHLAFLDLQKSQALLTFLALRLASGFSAGGGVSAIEALSLFRVTGGEDPGMIRA